MSGSGYTLTVSRRDAFDAYVGKPFKLILKGSVQGTFRVRSIEPAALGYWRIRLATSEEETSLCIALMDIKGGEVWGEPSAKEGE